ncbi:MAG: hypothetical protein M0Q91_06460 [Methanoregula sp.]|jgi:hypothetical protein|nr:hypothetical protein [Methanoregula sp.]
MIIYAKLRAPILLLAGILFLCISPVTAIDQIAIDPVPGNLTTGSVIEFAGTTTLPVGTNLYYEFSREAAGTGEVRYGEYSGAEGIIPVGKGSAGQVWKVPILTEGYKTGEYIFRIGKEGSDDLVSVRVQLAQGAPASTLKATQPAVRVMFESPLYVSPMGNFTVETIPDLNTRSNILAKGAPLTITTATSPGNSVGIWITSGFPVTRYTHFQMISADGSGEAEYDIPNTTSLRSGQYFIYVVDGGKALEVIPDEKDPSAFLSVEVLEKELKTHEQQNPYQKFMILLEEPTIRINEIPDAIFGTPVEMSGTTNLNAGTILSIEIFPPDIDRLKQPAFTVSGIPVAEGTNGNGSWHAVINTSDLPPGEYIVKVRNDSIEAARIMVLFDSLYDPGISPKGTLIAKTYEVDPETKTIITGTPARKAGFPADPGILVMACSAGIIGIGVIVNNLRKK